MAGGTTSGTGPEEQRLASVRRQQAAEDVAHHDEEEEQVAEQQHPPREADGRGASCQGQATTRTEGLPPAIYQPKPPSAKVIVTSLLIVRNISCVTFPETPRIDEC